MIDLASDVAAPFSGGQEIKPEAAPGLDPITVSDEAEIKNLAPGTKFKAANDPTGQVLSVPYEVKEERDILDVPEGASWIDPAGNKHEKPVSQPLNFTAQTLYNMSTNDKEREKALKRSYPGKVKKDPLSGEYYVDDDGVMRKPKGFTGAPGAYMAGVAAPTAGAIGGEILGGIGGSAASPGPGTVLGAMGGAAIGSGLGQGFNDVIMQLSGVYDRTQGDEITELGQSGAAAAIGTGAGRPLAGAAPAIKGAIQQGGPKAAAKFLGADKAGLAAAIKMREKGLELVPPSMWAKEAPHVINLVEVLDPAFRTQKPLLKAAEKYYQDTGTSILRRAGVEDPGDLLNPKAAIPTKEAGEALRDRMVAESAEADRKLAATLDQRPLPTQDIAGQKDAALREYDNAQTAAQKLIDVGFNDIDQSVKHALTVAKAGSNSGDMWWSVAEKMKAIRTGIGERANKMYGDADAMAGGAKPDSSSLPELANKFLGEVPPDFQTRYPSVIQKLRDLAGVPKLDKEGNQVGWTKPPVQPTFGQLHNIRSLLRDGADWYTMSSDVKNGSMKFFSKAVDNVLHDSEAGPELKGAAQALDHADAFYKENMGVFNARNIKAVMDGIKAGEPADPKLLFNAIVKEGHSDLTKKVLDMVGPSLANGIRAADVDTMLTNSRGLLPNTIDGKKFVSEVLERHRSDMLHAVHGKEMGDKLLKQAQLIAAVDGKLDIPMRPGDTALDVVNRLKHAKDVAQEAAKMNPLGELSRAAKQAERDKTLTLRKAQAERRAEPLGFLYDPSMGGIEAANKILGNEDLMIAAGTKFAGKPEFEMLKQIYLQDVFRGSMDIGSKLAKMSPEVQNMMFPGVTREDLAGLAKEMDFLMGTRALGPSQGAGSSMMAVSRVEHPAGSGMFGKAVGKVPGVDPALRFALGTYYKMATNLTSNLSFLKWVEKGLKGDPAMREQIKREVQRRMQVGGAIGAGATESQYQAPTGPQ